jgi:hypothetical protein
MAGVEGLMQEDSGCQVVARANTFGTAHILEVLGVPRLFAR